MDKSINPIYRTFSRSTKATTAMQPNLVTAAITAPLPVPTVPSVAVPNPIAWMQGLGGTPAVPSADTAAGQPSNNLIKQSMDLWDFNPGQMPGVGGPLGANNWSDLLIRGGG